MDPQDPKSMSDEELQAAIDGNEPTNQGPPADDPGNQTPPTPAPTDEPAGDDPKRTSDGRFAPKEDEPAGGEPQGDPQNEPQHDPDEPKPPSRREQLRIAQVLERVKNGNARPTPGQNPQVPPREGAIDYSRELDAEPEVIARLEEDRRIAEDARYQEGLRQAEGYQWRTLLQVDAPQVEREHPQLDKNSSEFHAPIASALTTMYLQMSGFDDNTGLPTNPGMRWSEFVESFWELADEIGKIDSQKVATEVARQAAHTAIRPDGNSGKLNLNKAPEHMSDAELDAYLASQGLAPSKR